MSDNNENQSLVNNVQMIKITAKTARYIVEQIGRFWRDGTGRSRYTEDVNTPPGIMDDVPMDTPVYVWLQYMLTFLHYVGGVLEHELDNLENNEE
jgi:hypothetical protein